MKRTISDSTCVPLHLTQAALDGYLHVVPSAIYDDLVFYFQYASSAYSTTCASPNGNTLVTEVSKSLTRSDAIDVVYAIYNLLAI